MKAGLISRANGSAYCEMENIKVAVGVYGPRQPLKKESFSEQCRLHCEFKFSTFAKAKRTGYQRDPMEKEWSRLIEQALLPAIRQELYPKSTIDLFVTVVEADGDASTLSAAILAASIALADAGIEMVDLVVASSASLYKDNVVLVDATANEEKHQQGWVVTASMPSLQEVTQVMLQGDAEPQRVAEILEKNVQNSARLYSVLSECLVDSIEAKKKKKTPARR